MGAFSCTYLEKKHPICVFLYNFFAISLYLQTSLYTKSILPFSDSSKAPKSVFLFLRINKIHPNWVLFHGKPLEKHPICAFCHFLSIKRQNNNLWSYKDNNLCILREKEMQVYTFGCFYGTFGCLESISTSTCTFCMLVLIDSLSFQQISLFTNNSKMRRFIWISIFNNFLTTLLGIQCSHVPLSESKHISN